MTALVVTGFAEGSFDASALWCGAADGFDALDAAAARSKQLARELAGVAHQALAAAGLGESRDVGCSVGSLYGYGHVAESIHDRLHAGGPSWLDPEQFVHYTAHVVAARLCVDHGLAGSATTLLGPDAGRQALAHAARSLRLGRHPGWVAGAYEVVSPAAAERLRALGIETDPARAEAAFVTLESRARAEARGVPVLAEPADLASIREAAGEPPTLAAVRAAAGRAVVEAAP